jgi:hypothetical protein
MTACKQTNQPESTTPTFLDDGHAEYTEVAVDDAPAHRSSPSLPVTPGPVTRVALGQEEAHSARGQHTLLHGEALLVVTPGDPQDIALGGDNHSYIYNMEIRSLSLPPLIRRT